MFFISSLKSALFSRTKRISNLCSSSRCRSPQSRFLHLSVCPLDQPENFEPHPIQKKKKHKQQAGITHQPKHTWQLHEKCIASPIVLIVLLIAVLLLFLLLIILFLFCFILFCFILFHFVFDIFIIFYFSKRWNRLSKVDNSQRITGAGRATSPTRGRAS